MLGHLRLGKQEQDEERTISKLLNIESSFHREIIADATNNGEKCAKLRIIELAETDVCNVICSPPGKSKIGLERGITSHVFS